MFTLFRARVVLTVMLVLAAKPALADVITILNPESFNTLFRDLIVDTYSHPGYYPTSADVTIHNSADMSAVLGETRYATTGWTNNNIIFSGPGDNRMYCGGCNGSILLMFDQTSIGSSRGVHGVSFRYGNLGPSGMSYTAFVTLGNGRMLDIPLLQTSGWNMSIFGLFAPQRISSIHLGLSNVATRSGSFFMDNLAIGANPVVPEPATLLTLGAALVGVGARSASARRRRSRALSRDRRHS